MRGEEGQCRRVDQVDIIGHLHRQVGADLGEAPEIALSHAHDAVAGLRLATALPSLRTVPANSRLRLRQKAPSSSSPSGRCCGRHDIEIS